eukprot:CAMPEP_0175682096 /NCGR_PEP_ID=MMETSP0097-20121207/25637_1 /TAXON_ID=311494 /ORGANISM="Alexandrium monilatum, Strain CCMP3105" /LENGTH=151 /DNA_ID=CAMNT_0016988967 /DNA_START=1 /DNA_END=456 /DNA_ORIENTATION=-
MRLDAQGLALMEELVAAMGRREALATKGSGAALHKLAVQELEPVFEHLHANAQAATALAEAAHDEVAAAFRGPEPHEAPEVAAAGAAATPSDSEDTWRLMKVADFLEQDAQLKVELVDGLSHSSTVAEVMAARVLWGTRPWLEHDALRETA